MKLLITALSLMILMSPMKTKATQASPKSRAEMTDYAETSRYADVMDFIAALQRLSDGVKVESFGVTNEVVTAIAAWVGEVSGETTA